MKITDLTVAHYNNLPKKRMGAGVVFFNEQGELLAVKPNYREGWLLVGGSVDEGESPCAAARREIQEEIGLDIEIRNLDFVAVGYASAKDIRTESIQFTFYGGVLSAERIAQIVLAKNELDAFKFFTEEEASKVLIPSLRENIRFYLNAIQNKKVIYLES